VPTDVRGQLAEKNQNRLVVEVEENLGGMTVEQQAKLTQAD